MIPVRTPHILCLSAILLAVLFCTVHSRAEDADATSGRIWSVQTDSARNPAGAAAAVLRLREEGQTDAQLLLLYGTGNSLWYVVELTATPNLSAARQAAAAFLRSSGRTPLVRSLDATLRTSRIVSDEQLHDTTGLKISVPEQSIAEPPKPVISAIDTESAPPSAPGQDEETMATAPTIEQYEQTPPATVQEAAVRNEEAPLTPFTADSKQAELIIARSTFRQGDLDQAYAMYRTLLSKYGPEEEILASYTETLIESRRWEEAEKELAAWRERRPDSLDALRQTARLYLLLAEENGNYEASYPWLEAVLERTPEDTGIQADYAYARLNAGDWHGALERFSEIYDANPEDENAAEVIQTIYRDRCPQLRFDFRSETQTGNVSINTLETEYSQQITPSWRLAASEERTRIDRSSSSDGTPSIGREVLRHALRSRYDIDTEWTVLSGVSFFSGKGEGLGVEAGVERRALLGGTFQLTGEYSTPWLSTLDAVDREGTTDTYTARYEKALNDFWTMSASAGAQRYSLENNSGYSWQEREEFALTRSIRYLPDISASYIFTRTRQHYRQSDPADRPVDLVDKEDIHTLRLDMLHWYNEYIGLRTFGSAGYDVFRLSPVYNAGAGLRIRLGERADIDVGAEYSSDTGQAGGGEAKAITSSIIFRF
ncbi:tetratricopeptide repeat protein [Desulfovibrio mangrovi]|uniref:tetratricopeptide repeat protein n=1 Tax=Desulfovibrio mangrovi TaxID=2976983 RepID=UPI0022471CD2|nr:tetratricopeptide repeat protein [Desulfovibrio mangrovi]UZP67398.1 tetratricopeptide repeat protein [Desulfovibrio mangrovi]